MPATITDNNVARELDRYLLLCSEMGPGLSMFSERIDAAWHQRLEMPDEYESSCLSLGIAPIGHVSAEEATLPSTLDWVNTYEARWGPLPEQWFADAEGRVDGVARQAYLSSRSVASTGCCQDTEWTPLGCCQDTE
jgi:hypothetical protein